MADEQYAVVNGWLVEVVDRHTCGTGPNGHYGAHEPGCGMIPIGKVEDLLKDASAAYEVRQMLLKPTEPNDFYINGFTTTLDSIADLYSDELATNLRTILRIEAS